MRGLILLAGALLAMNAMADDKHKPITVTKPLDKASPVLMSTGDDSEATDAKEMHNRSKSRAQDYNSSRSNNVNGAAATPGTPRPSATRARDYNSSRSNNVNGVAAPPVTPRPGATRAQDYNSSRSNTTALRPEVDDEVVCTDGVDDDCDGVEDEAPANHNTTRSR